MTVPSLDTQDFTRRGDSVSGRLAVPELPRLCSLLVSEEGHLDWHLRGESQVRADGSRVARMALELSGTVTMRCVRCLETLAVILDEYLEYRLVPTEAEAEREDAEDDESDVLVSSRHFDLAGLIEDETIMALPAAPRHPDCRAPGPSSAETEAVSEHDADQDEAQPADRPNPFAALAALRSGAKRGDDTQ